MKKAVKYFLFLLLIVFFSCKKEKSTPKEMGYAYFPLTTGYSVTYQVDSIVYDNFYDPVKITDYKYQLKVEVADSFEDNSGNIVYRLLRYKRNSDTSDWAVSDVWQISRTTTQALKTEENAKYLKMIFPITPYDTWNGNAYNTNSKETYQYLDFRDTTINNLSFKNSITVEELNNKNLIEDQYFVEIYAKNVGLVCKIIRDLKTDFDGNITSGVNYSQVVIDYN